MLHSDPAWASFALSSFNIFIEILLKGVLFKLFFTSLVFSSILQHCALLTSALLTCALFSSAHLSWTPLYQRPFVLRFFDGGLHQRALRAYVGEHLLWWPLNILQKALFQMFESTLNTPVLREILRQVWFYLFSKISLFPYGNAFLNKNTWKHIFEQR